MRSKKQSDREKAWDALTTQFINQVAWPEMTKERLSKKWKNLKVSLIFLPATSVQVNVS